MRGHNLFNLQDDRYQQIARQHEAKEGVSQINTRETQTNKTHQISWLHGAQHGQGTRDSPKPARRPLPAEALLVHGALGGLPLLLMPERASVDLAIGSPSVFTFRIASNVSREECVQRRAVGLKAGWGQLIAGKKTATRRSAFAKRRDETLCSTVYRLYHRVFVTVAGWICMYRRRTLRYECITVTLP